MYSGQILNLRSTEIQPHEMGWGGEQVEELIVSSNFQSIYLKIVSDGRVGCQRSDLHFLLRLGQHGPAMLVHEKSGGSGTQHFKEAGNRLLDGYAFPSKFCLQVKFMIERKQVNGICICWALTRDQQEEATARS